MQLHIPYVHEALHLPSHERQVKQLYRAAYVMISSDVLSAAAALSAGLRHHHAQARMLAAHACTPYICSAPGSCNMKHANTAIPDALETLSLQHDSVMQLAVAQLLAHVQTVP